MTFMRIRISLGCCALLLTALVVQARAADPVWIQLNSPNFVLYTDTTEMKGRRLLEDFEGRFAALQEALGDIPQRQFPVEVFLFSRKEDFLEAAPSPTGPNAPVEFEKSAYLWRGPDRFFIGARDRAPEDISNDVGHALGHIFIERIVVWRPFWLAEGGAEYFRRVGRSPENRRISDKDAYLLEDLVDIVQPPKYDDAAATQSIVAFRVQAHRLFRLMTSQSHAGELRTYLKELRSLEGQGTKLAVKPLQAEFETFTETIVGLKAGGVAIKTSPLTPDAMSIHRGDLLVAATKVSEAASWYQANRAEARAARAILARFSRSGSEPLRLLTRAAAEMPDAGLVQFHAGSVQTKNPEDLQFQARALERAVTLLPRFGRAHGQLARVNILLGKAETAVTQVERAIELEPEYADQFTMIRAEALLSLGRFSESAATARTAASLPHADASVDYELRSAEIARRAEEARRELEARQLDRIRDQVRAIVNEREPPVVAPPPVDRPPPLSGRIEYNVQSTRQLSIVDAPLPIYRDTLVEKSATGRITIRVTIGPDGKVTQASIVDSQLPEMSASTLDAAKKWTFSPAAGRPPFEARIIFTFSVQ
ncbi:MAG TPA: TonB family protein [Terriglobia bacterium]|nr:TonB family protein [Terriglobia bacterium]